MINGLDDLLKSSTKNVHATPGNKVQVPPTLESAGPSAVSLQAPSIGNLMDTPAGECSLLTCTCMAVLSHASGSTTSLT